MICCVFFSLSLSRGRLSTCEWIHSSTERVKQKTHSERRSMNSDSPTSDDVKTMSTSTPTPRGKTLSSDGKKNGSMKKNYNLGLFWKIAKLNKGLNKETIEKALDDIEKKNCNKECFDKVVESGVVPQFIAILEKKECPLELTIGICSLLSDIMWANSKHDKLMIDNGIILVLMKLMTSQNTTLLNTILHCLGNMADNLNHDEESILLTTDGFLSKFVGIFHKTKKMIPLILLKTASWSLMEICRNLPKSPLVFMNVAIPFFLGVIRHPKLKEEEGYYCLSNALWGINYITENQQLGIDIALHEKGIVQSIIPFLNSKVSIVQLPALRILSNLVGGTDKQCSKVLKLGLLDFVKPLLSDKNPIIQKETVWMISNIVAGTISQVKQVFSTTGIIPIILKLFKLKTNHSLRRECSFVVSNTLSNPLVSKTSVVNLEFILSCIKGICYGLDSDIQTSASPMLEALMLTITHARSLSMDGVKIVLYWIRTTNVLSLVQSLLEKYRKKVDRIDELCKKITINCSVLKSCLVTMKLKKKMMN